MADTGSNKILWRGVRAVIYIVVALMFVPTQFAQPLEHAGQSVKHVIQEHTGKK